MTNKFSVDPGYEGPKLSDEEVKAIKSLRRLAKRWPDTLWLFSANGSLCVMRKGLNGEHVTDPPNEAGAGMCQAMRITAIQGIDNDGGDW